MTRLQNRYKITVPWKDKEQDARDLARGFGYDNAEWEEAFDDGYC